MRRWHQERNLMLRRWRQELANHSSEYGQKYAHCYLAPPADANGVGCHCSRGIGVMRKTRPYGCGNPRCGICHYDKWDAPGAQNYARATRKRTAIEFELIA